MSTQTYPYDDTAMKYDLSRRQYILTHEGVKSELDIDLVTALGTPRKADIFLEEISDDIYEYIYGYTLLSEIEYKTHRIAKDETLRETFKRILLSQVRYAYRSGGNLLKDMHGVNIEKGASKTIELSDLRGDRGISGSAIRLMLQNGLLYSGYYGYKNTTINDGTY